MKLLMVCLGNICRSPLAEGILKDKLSKEFTVDSAGTIAMHLGEHPDYRSVAVAKEHGLDISSQKSRPITASDLDTFDKIYCMDMNNLEDVIALSKTDEQRRKISLLLKSAGHQTSVEVPDPYYGGMDGFENVYQLLDEACTVIANELMNNQ